MSYLRQIGKDYPEYYGKGEDNVGRIVIDFTFNHGSQTIRSDQFKEARGSKSLHSGAGILAQ